MKVQRSKVGREATISHREVDGHTYVIIDAPYQDCGKASDARYSGGFCHCDACMDAHATRARRWHINVRRRREAS